jgi:multidrug efflux pump subunit AcrA (membrane-fusion protein)
LVGIASRGESSSRSSKDKDGTRKSRRGRKWLIAAVVVVLMIVVPLELKVAGSINVLPIHNADVRAEIDGMISEVLVDEGQHVNAGDPIVRIVDRDLRAELEKTEGLAGESRARLRLLEAGSRPEEIEVAMTTVARHEEQLRYHRGRLDRFKALNEQQLTSMLDYEESARLVASAESDLAEAKKKLTCCSPERARKRLRRCVAPWRARNHRSATCRATATDRSHKSCGGNCDNAFSPAEGDEASGCRKRRPDSEGPGFETIRAEIAVSEKEIADVRNGQTVALKVRAFPERVFPGKVTDIATTAGDGGAAAPTTAAPKSGLLPDATGDAGKSANAILVTTGNRQRRRIAQARHDRHGEDLLRQTPDHHADDAPLSRTFRVEFWVLVVS